MTSASESRSPIILPFSSGISPPFSTVQSASVPAMSFHIPLLMPSLPSEVPVPGPPVPGGPAIAANFAAPPAAIPSRRANCAALRGNACQRCRAALPHPFEMTDGARFDHRYEAQDGEGDEGGQHQQGAAGQHGSEAGSGFARSCGPRSHRSRGQAQGRHDDELRQDQRRQRLHQARHQCATDGQTSVARARGRKRTAT